MKFIKNILAVNPYLNLALIIAIVSAVLMETYLFDIPELVSWGEEFGTIYYKLCLSLMASYIFYFIVIHLKSQSDKENINAFVATKSYGVIGDYKSQIQALKKEVNSKIPDDYLSKEQIEDVFKTINPKNNAPLLLGQFGSYANWIQYMSYYKDRTQKLIQKIFIKMPFLDSKLVRLLAEIDDCTHFGVIESMLNLKFGNNDMSAWASSFYEYSIKCKELEQYNEKNLSKYKP